MVEQQTFNLRVVGSSPAGGTAAHALQRIGHLPSKSYFNPVNFFDYAVDVNINGTTGPTVWLENNGPITTLVWEGDKRITADTISHTTRIRLTRHMGNTMYTMSFRDEDIIFALTNLFFFNTQAPYNQGV